MSKILSTVTGGITAIIRWIRRFFVMVLAGGVVVVSGLFWYMAVRDIPLSDVEQKELREVHAPPIPHVSMYRDVATWAEQRERERTLSLSVSRDVFAPLEEEEKNDVADVTLTVPRRVL